MSTINANAMAMITAIANHSKNEVSRSICLAILEKKKTIEQAKTEGWGSFINAVLSGDYNKAWTYGDILNRAALSKADFGAKAERWELEEEVEPEEDDEEEFEQYDGSDDDESYNEDNYSSSQRMWADRSDAAGAAYDRGEIDAIQRAERRMGA